MICAPCSHYDPATNLCLGSLGMGLKDQKKDLDVLQRLGLKYGDTIPAGKLYDLLFERIERAEEICGYIDGIVRAPEWKICNSIGNYAKGRKEGLGIPRDR